MRRNARKKQLTISVENLLVPFMLLGWFRMVELEKLKERRTWRCRTRTHAYNRAVCWP